MPFADEYYSPSIESTSVMFRTHWNYVKCLNRLFSGAQIQINVDVNTYVDPAPAGRFEKLSQITLKGIQQELQACHQEVTYASVIAPWIPVKCYYRLYYLESILLYFLDIDYRGFHNGGHTSVRSSLLANLESGRISISGVSATELSEIRTWEQATSFSTYPGSNIGGDYHMYPDCHQSIKKKVAEYIKIDWMQKKKITSFRTAAARLLRDRELKPKKFLLWDYFYWMRIKANYRDVDFLDFEHDIRAADSHEYIKEFTESSEKYASALIGAITYIKDRRGIRL